MYEFSKKDSNQSSSNQIFVLVKWCTNYQYFTQDSILCFLFQENSKKCVCKVLKSLESTEEKDWRKILFRPHADINMLLLLTANILLENTCRYQGDVSFSCCASYILLQICLIHLHIKLMFIRQPWIYSLLLFINFIQVKNL